MTSIYREPEPRHWISPWERNPLTGCWERWYLPADPEPVGGPEPLVKRVNWPDAP